jgi:hypothetical protein
MVGFSVDGASPKVQLQALLAFITVFGVVAGAFTTDLLSLIWFGIAGLSGVTFLLVTFLMSE